MATQGINTKMTLSDNVNASVNKMIGSFKKLNDNVTRAEKAATKAENALKIPDAGRGIKKTAEEMDKLKKKTELAGQSATKTGSIFKGAFLANMASAGIAKAGDLLSSAAGSMLDQAKYQKVFGILMGSKEQGDALFKKQMSAAAQSSFDPADMMKNTQAFLPLAQGNEGRLDKANNIAQRLAAFDTTGQGLSGAGFSVKEAMTGDFQSIIERFNISRSAINNSGIRDIAASGDIDGVLSKLDELMNGWNMTTEGMAQALDNPRDKFMMFVNNSKAALGSAMSSMLTSLTPLIDKWNAWLGSDAGKATIEQIGTAISNFVILATQGIEWVIGVWDKWGGVIKTIAWIVVGIIATMWLFNTVLWVVNGTIAIVAAVKAIWATATAIAAAAQTGLNAALWACPIAWIVAAIVALIVVIVAVVIALFYWSDALGTVVGAWLWMWSIVTNVFKWIWNGIIEIGEFIWNNFDTALSAVANLFIWLYNEGILGFIRLVFMAFTGVGDFIANTFVNIVNGAISGLNWLIDKANKIPGVKIENIGTWEAKSSMTDDMNKTVDSWKMQYTKPDDSAASFDKNKAQYTDPGAEYDKGFNLGKAIAETTKAKLGGLLDMVNGKAKVDDPNAPGGSQGDPNYTTVAGGTIDKIEEEVKIGDEIVKVLEDFAKLNFQQNIIQLTPTLNVENLNNNGNADPEVFLKKLSSGINSEISRKASGVGVAW